MHLNLVRCAMLDVQPILAAWEALSKIDISTEGVNDTLQFAKDDLCKEFFRIVSELVTSEVKK